MGKADGETPLVTVCITTFERPALLAEAIASIEAQTYPAIEIVVVDDGSRKPETLAALDRLAAAFAPRGWQVLRQENAYVGAARNTGTAAARGEYILFMDDDDVAVPEEVATFVAVARRTGADILTCASSLFEGAEPPARPERLWVALGGALGAGIFQNAFGSVNAFWRRQVYLDLGGHTTDYGIGYEDWEMFAQAMIAGYRLDLVPRALFHYRVSTTGMLRTTDVDTNLARSARAFVKHAPLGLGVAIGHAVHLERQHELARRKRPTYGELIRRDIGWTRRWLRRRLRRWFGI
ncbi:MAG: glycosyltransferase family A protein [Hyphomicrobiales bacterium]